MNLSISFRTSWSTSVMATRFCFLSSISCSNIAAKTGLRAGEDKKNSYYFQVQTRKVSSLPARIALCAWNSRPPTDSVTSLNFSLSNRLPKSSESLHSGTLNWMMLLCPDIFTLSATTLTYSTTHKWQKRDCNEKRENREEMFSKSDLLMFQLLWHRRFEGQARWAGYVNDQIWQNVSSMREEFLRF